MFTAGVFGTVLGDQISHLVGEGVASVVLLAVLFAVLAAGRRRAAQIIALYWTTVAVARTAGTAVGDWLAESKTVNIGLRLSTLFTGLAFVAVLVFWRSRAKESRAPIESPSGAV